MAAGEEWDAIQADPEFQAQPASEKTRVALSFFNKRVAPQVTAHAGDVDQARHDFFSDTFKAPNAPAQPSIPAMAGAAAMDTLKSPVPVLGKVADAVRTDIPGVIAEEGGKLGFPKTGAAIGTTVGTVGELIPKTGAELAMAGLGGPALEGAGELGAKAAPTLLSKASLGNLSVPEAGRAISRAKELMNPTLLKPETIDNATQALGDSIKTARSALGRRLGVAEDVAAAKSPGRILPTGQIADELAGNLQKARIAADGKLITDTGNPVKPQVQDIIDKLRNADSGVPEIPPKPTGILDAKGAPVMTAGTPGVPPAPRPLPLEDAIGTKRDIYDLVSYDKSKLLGLGDKESTFLKGAASKLDDQIRTVSPELNAATDNFSRAAKGYDNLQKNALAGKVDTVQKRLGTIFKAGDIARKVTDPLAAAGGGQAALDTLLDAKVAQKMAPLTNPVLNRAATHTGGGILGASGLGGAAGYAAMHGNFAPAAAAAVAGAVTSPALQNALVRATMVPIGQSAVVDAAASPLSRALVTSPLIRRLRGGSK